MIDVDARDAVELPVDELALRVLADLADHEQPSPYNYVNGLRSDTARGYAASLDARQAIAEALEWLRSHGMIADRLDEPHGSGVFVTRWGRRAVAMNLHDLHAVERVQDNLHPLLQGKIRRQFLLGEYEMAIFVALKAVEVRVRELGKFGNEVIGVPLMTQAFKPGGPLADPAAPVGEVEGTMALFRGAYAVLRNPSGHREVSFDDVTEASEAVMTASLLMRMLDRIEQRLKPPVV